MFSFQPRNPDEMTALEGATVQVDENHEAPVGWLFGTSGNSSGLFPANYAQKVVDEYVDIDDASKVIPISQNKIVAELPTNQP